MKIKIRIYKERMLDYGMLFFVCYRNVSVEKFRLVMSKKGTYYRVLQYFKSAKSLRIINKIKRLETEIRKLEREI